MKLTKLSSNEAYFSSVFLKSVVSDRRLLRENFVQLNTHAITVLRLTSTEPFCVKDISNPKHFKNELASPVVAASSWSKHFEAVRERRRKDEKKKTKKRKHRKAPSKEKRSDRRPKSLPQKWRMTTVITVERRTLIQLSVDAYKVFDSLYMM